MLIWILQRNPALPPHTDDVGPLWEFLLRPQKAQPASGTLSPASTSWSLGEFLRSGWLTGDLCCGGNRVAPSEDGQTFNSWSSNTFAWRGADVEGIYLIDFVEVVQSRQGEEFWGATDVPSLPRLQGAQHYHCSPRHLAKLRSMWIWHLRSRWIWHLMALIPPLLGITKGGGVQSYRRQAAVG